MELYYENTDITEDVDVVRCVHHESSSGRCDCLEIELEHAAAWYSWGPKQDDRIIAALNGYNTGQMYLNTVLPQEGRFRILATSIPNAARRTAWRSYAGMTLSEILADCAAECGMDSRIYGLDSRITYPFLLRRGESGAAFLSRLLEWEGAVFKTFSGRFMGIGIEYAQEMDAKQVIEISPDQPGVTYLRRDSERLSGITLKTPYAVCSAVDNAAPSGNWAVYTELPVLDEVSGGRWARGTLLTHNRRAEELTISSEFNAGFSSMTRIDVDSGTDMAGAWIIDEAEHDFINKTSKAKMYRCINTIR